MPEPTPPTRRRWFRFGLRSLLVFTALVGLLMGWIVKERRQSAREVAIAEEFREHGWVVWCGSKFSTMESSIGKEKPNWWRQLARTVLGDRIVLLATSQDTRTSNIAVLRELTSLRVLMISKTEITDFSALSSLKTLNALMILDTRLQDASPLHGLPELRSLSVQGTQLTHDQIIALQKALPKCQVAHDFTWTGHHSKEPWQPED